MENRQAALRRTIAINRFASLGAALALLIAGVACAGGAGGGGGSMRRPPGSTPAPASASARGTNGPQEYDPIELFRRMGLLARGAPMPFVGSVSFFASASPDSTHALVALSLANAALTFAREEDKFRAGYTVTITLRKGPTVLRNIEAHEEVVVGSYKETSRTDESVLYEEVITLSPGRYQFTVGVRDDGSAKAAEDAATLEVPATMSEGLSTPVSFARAGIRSRLAMLPQIIVNPTASATFGRDSVVPFFVEAYGKGGSTRRVRYLVRADNGRPIYQDSAVLPLRSGLFGGTIEVPIAHVGIGAMMLSVWQDGDRDTVRAPLFVGFGAELPLASYEEMVNYLRWFASPYRIQQLKDTPPEARPTAWADFVSYYAKVYRSPDALREYFARLAEANAKFKEEASPGWLTDRGKVLLGLGRPDQVVDQVGGGLSTRGQQQVWEYRGLNLAVTFYDQNGFGRWKLTPTSDAEFLSAWRQRVQ